MKPTLVPQGGTALDVLAERYRAAFTKMEGGREQWIEGTLELALVVRHARIEYPDHRAFSQWQERHTLRKLDKNQVTSLLWMATDLKTARTTLEQTSSKSLELIYRNRPQRTLPNPRRGAPQTFSRRSGASQRKRRIPDVMREDNPPPPPAPRKRLSDFGLTPEQVDPDFKGTALEFATKYGHVNLHTKGEIEQTKRQEALAAWLGAMADHERTGRAMLAALAAVDSVTLREWMSKPSKAEKLRAWHNSVQIPCEAIGKLCG